MHLRHHRPGHLHGVVLLGHGAEIAQVVSAVVDPADKGPLAIDHHDLAVQASEQVGAHAGDPRLRVEGMEADTGIGQRCHEAVGQVGGAVAVHRHLYPYAAPGGIDQHALQLLADLVVENDEGFQQDLFLCLGHCLEYTG